MSAMSRPSSLLRSMVFACALSAGVGCAEDANSVYIRGVKQPLAAAAGCTFPADPTAPSNFEGVLDLAFKSNYHLAPLIQSNVFARADMAANRTESNQIFIEGFVIEVREDSPTGNLITGTGFTNPYSVFQSVVIPPGVGGLPGTGIAFFEALPPLIGRLLYQDVCVTRGGIRRPTGLDARCPVPVYNPDITRRIMLRVTAFGHTGGGVSIETPKYDFPINVCCGCLRLFPPAMAAAAAPDAGTRVTPVCNVAVPMLGPASCPNITGQDYPVDCNLCSSARPDLCQPFGFVRPDLGAGVVCE